ncbi:MAG: glycosyltransferase family 2 protein [Acidimicrobiia bacterium]
MTSTRDAVEARSEDCNPTFSVIVPTFNRARLLPRAIQSVLDQRFDDFELIVVDDGSTDSTPDVVTRLSDARLHYLRQENQGLSVARNTGASAARGEWLAFLDDDDQALTDWLGNFHRGSAPDVGMVCCGFTVTDEQGNAVRSVAPRELGEVHDNQVGQLIAGAFAVRRRLFEAVHGYAPGLKSTHSTELALRLVPFCLGEGLAVRSVPDPGLRIEYRPPARRSLRSAELLYDGVSYILEHHRERLSRTPRVLANYSSIAGVSAARLGRSRDAIRLLADAVRAEPFAVRRWVRLVLAMVPPLGSWVWRRRDTGVTREGMHPSG